MAGPQTQREFAIEVVRTLRGAGYEALWAGGSVRDALLGLKPKDYDVATSALPDQVREVFGKKRTLAIGAAFGVITVLGPKSAGQIEVATFRSDAGYSDGRRPDAVQFTNAEQDAQRRDFTINGLFFDPIEERVIDFVGGQADLDSKVIRAIGDPEARFDEDKLRMLRAVRFAASLGFTLDPPTAAAIGDHAAQIELVSAERIGAEVRRMLVDRNRARAVELLAEVGLLGAVFPDWREPASEEFAGTVSALDRLEQPSLPLALACFLAPFKTESRRPVRAAANSLKFTKREGELAQWFADNVGFIEQANQLPWPQLQPVLAHTGGGELVRLREALAGGPDEASRFCREKLSLPLAELDPPPLLTGDDLVGSGFRPGPQFAVWLQQVRAAQLTGEIDSKQQAIELVQRIANSSE